MLTDEAGNLTWSGIESLNNSVRPSLDLRFGITPNIGAAFTINPDFSQVEADVTQVNLNQRFAFRYAEQRPFFLDGIDAFADPNATLHTRSIVSPLYGVKLTGQEGPVSVGVLQSIDGQPGVSVHEQKTPGFFEEDLADAFAENAVGRLRIDAFGSGAIGFTAADKRIINGTGGYSDVLAADVSVPVGDSGLVSGFGAASIAGDNTETLSGGRANISLARSPALGTGVGLSATEITPGYRQEMGALNQSGLRAVSARVNHTHGQDRRLWTSTLSSSGTFERDTDRALSAQLSQNATLGVHSAAITGSLSRWNQLDENDESQEVDGYALSGSWGANLNRTVRLSLASALRREIDFVALVPADTVQTTAAGTLRLTTATRFDFDVNRQWYTLEGDTTQALTRLYSRFNWQFLEPVGLRLVQQSAFNSEAVTLTTLSSLLTWMRTPGNELYVGASWSMDPDSGLTEQILFAKLTHLWRL